MRATQRDRIFFRIPRNQLRKDGLTRLRTLEGYNNWKIAIRGLANAQKFQLPEQGLEIKFCIPIPKTWKKYKQREMNGKLHQQKPDLSNLLKAFEDAMISEDKFIAHYAGLSKVWVLEPEGRIEITIHMPVHSSLDTLL